MFHTCHWGNAIENSHEIPLHTYQNPEHWQHQMLAKMCSSRNSHSLLVEIQNGYGHFGTQLGIQKLTHGCLLHNSVQFSSISKTWKQPRCPSVHKSPQSCTTLSDPMDCSLPDSSVHGILQARILEQVAMPSSRGSSWPRDWICISYATKIYCPWCPFNTLDFLSFFGSWFIWLNYSLCFIACKEKWRGEDLF